MSMDPQKALLWWKKVTSQQDMIDIDKNVFGVALTESLRYAHARITYTDSTGATCNGILPIVVARCGAFLKAKDMLALSTEGIFRISGNAKRVGMLQTMFDHDDYGLTIVWDGYTVHDVSNVMRRFLNQLPEPVINLEYQSMFKTTLEAKVNAFQSLIQKLPIVHQFLLLYLLDLLYLFSLHADTTRMDLCSLATAFAPVSMGALYFPQTHREQVIFSDPSDGLNLEGYKESQRVLKFLIINQNRFSIPRISANDVLQYSSYQYDQSNAMYTPSRSSTDLNTMITTTLKRSNTAPSKRNLSSPSRPIGRWKSIKIV
ncbi:hypothetical protein CU098_002720, partial [Rhizopus stolonifer]